jgi:molybdopterin/thiamine biosynthesis adenylyltransferase
VSWDAELAAARDTFIHEMSKLGIHYDEARSTTTGEPVLAGRIEIDPGRHVDVEVALVEGWPYRPCKVRPEKAAGTMSWHQERDRSLCLWTGAEDDRPWASASRVVERTREWFRADAAGWPDDPPDLDLERYFRPAEGPLVVYHDVERLVGGTFKTRTRGADAVELVPSSKSVAKLRSSHGWAIDLGELTHPVHDWDEVADRIGEIADTIEAHVRRVAQCYLLLVYSRDGHQGAVTLVVTLHEDEEIELHALETASQSEEVMKLRAGADAPFLQEHTVGVVGVGAVGSYLADLLARAGVGRLALADSEVLRPGNCIRHLCGTAHVGKTKTAAVRDVLADGGHLPPDGVELRGAIRTPRQALQLMGEVSLVVDATGNPAASAMLEDAARHTGKHCLSVYLQRDGGVVRVDRWPLLDGETPLDPVPTPDDSDTPVLREAGCGDPVSPTPGHAVAAAAGHAARAAADLLRNRPVATSTLYVVDPQPDYERGVFT